MLSQSHLMTEAVDGESAEGPLDSAATWRIKGTSKLDLAAAVVAARPAALLLVGLLVSSELLARAGLEVLASAGLA